MSGHKNHASQFGTVLTLTAGGAEFTCHVAGSESVDPDPIVLLHGIGGSTATDYSFLFPMLARHHRVVGIDFGEPRLDADELLRLDHLVLQVQAAVNTLLPGRRVSIVGYSLGAAVAVAAASSHEAIARIVLVSGWLKSSARQQLFTTIWRNLRVENAAVLTDFARFAAFGSAYLDGRTQEEIEANPPMAVGSFTAAQVELAATIDLTGIAPQIGVPTLVVGCSDDGIATPEQSKALFGAIIDARLVEVDSGHAVTMERPAELLSHIGDFLGDDARYPAGSILGKARA